jgi:hypothetical protein
MCKYSKKQGEHPFTSIFSSASRALVKDAAATKDADQRMLTKGC